MGSLEGNLHKRYTMERNTAGFFRPPIQYLWAVRELFVLQMNRSERAAFVGVKEFGSKVSF